MEFVVAYIDAGTGSLLAQMLVGGIAGIGVFMKYRWQSIRARFGRAQAEQAPVD